jgi:hypothetical protein
MIGAHARLAQDEEPGRAGGEAGGGRGLALEECRDSYTVCEYVGEMAPHCAPYSWLRADRGRRQRPKAVMVELAEYAPLLILLAVVFVLASTRPAR